MSNEASMSGDEAALSGYATALVDAVSVSIEPWVVTQIEKFWLDETPDAVQKAADAAGGRAAAELTPKLRSLLELDIDEQWANPLAILRTAAEYPTAVLREIGVAPVERDNTAKKFHPNDIYDLTPGGFAAFGADVGDAGLRWGAAKAHVHLRRRAEKAS